MFQHQNIWLPDGEKHFPEWMTRNGEIVNGKGTYQIKKLREAMKWCRQFRRAVDVGAHVGLWSMHLAGKFSMLNAFEPVPKFRDCWRMNMGAESVDVSASYQLHCFALGATDDTWALMSINPADTGGTHVSVERPSVVNHMDATPMMTLDSFKFEDVDFIKIDCEGYELEVLKGAWRTIARSKPCVIVEQKPHKLLPNFGIKGAPAVDYLRDMGAVLRKEIGGDYILSWDA